jgi:hypothetical protein
MAGRDMGVRFWVFVPIGTPGTGLWRVPVGFEPDVYAERVGAVTLFTGTAADKRLVRRYARS